MTWATPWDVDFSANWRYLSGVKLDSNTSNPLLHERQDRLSTDATINDFWYLDLAADWNVRTGVDLHAGVNNVFDRLPPALSSAVLPVGPGNDNTFPGTYDCARPHLLHRCDDQILSTRLSKLQRRPDGPPFCSFLPSAKRGRRINSAVKGLLYSSLSPLISNRNQLLCSA